MTTKLKEGDIFAASLKEKLRRYKLFKHRLQVLLHINRYNGTVRWVPNVWELIDAMKSGQQEPWPTVVGKYSYIPESKKVMFISIQLVYYEIWT